MIVIFIYTIANYNQSTRFRQIFFKIIRPVSVSVTRDPGICAVPWTSFSLCVCRFFSIFSLYQCRFLSIFFSVCESFLGHIFFFTSAVYIAFLSMYVRVVPWASVLCNSAVWKHLFPYMLVVSWTCFCCANADY